MDKITTIKVNKADVKLTRRIMAELDSKSMRDLFHKFVQSYYAVLLLTPQEETVELEIEVDENE